MSSVLPYFVGGAGAVLGAGISFLAVRLTSRDARAAQRDAVYASKLWDRRAELYLAATHNYIDFVTRDSDEFIIEPFREAGGEYDAYPAKFRAFASDYVLGLFQIFYGGLDELASARLIGSDRATQRAIETRIIDQAKALVQAMREELAGAETGTPTKAGNRLLPLTSRFQR